MALRRWPGESCGGALRGALSMELSGMIRIFFASPGAARAGVLGELSALSAGVAPAAARVCALVSEWSDGKGSQKRM